MSVLLGSIVINRRFNGPPGSANGGYASGRLAQFIDGPAQVTLHRPPPLDQQLDVASGDPEGLVLRHGGTVIGEAVAVPDVNVVPPVRPDLDEAEAARMRHPGRGIRHLLSDCFVCGPEREDGLRVSAGPVRGSPEVFAAPFAPDPGLARGGIVEPEVLWAALDCPSYPLATFGSGRISLLGRLSASLERSVGVDERLIAVGWTLAVDGRKRQTASALLSQDGHIVAAARAVWIELTM